MKQPADRTNKSADGPGFLFVNKTSKSKSLSKSDGAVAKQINRHAQHFRTRKLEVQKVSSARTNCSSARRIALDGWNKKQNGQGSSSDESSPATSPIEESTETSPPSFPVRADETFSPVIVSTSRSPANGRNLSRKPLSVQDLLGVDQPQRNTKQLRFEEEDAELELSSPVYRANFTAYDCIDPFGSTPVQITPKIHTVLQYTLRIYPYAGNNYKLAFLPKHIKATITQFPIGAVVQRSVYKEHHLYSLMAAMLARMKHIFIALPTGDDPDVVRAQAARYLRKELIRCSRSGNVDKQTILDILFLCVNETQYRRYEDVRKHLTIVGKLLSLLDTNETLDRWISETAAHVDNQYALATGNKPVIPYTFDPGPMLPERMAILRREAHNLKYYGYPNPTALIVPRGPDGSMGLTDVTADLAATLDLRMGSKFTQALKAGAFPEAMARIISDLVDCIEIAKVVWLSPLAVCFDVEWLCRKARAVLRALLAIAPERSIGPMDLIQKCTECCRLSLIIMLTHACTLVGFQTAKSTMPRLKNSLQYALKHWCPTLGWTEDCKPLVPGSRVGPALELAASAVLWTLFTGCWAAEDLPEQEFFMERALNICQYFKYTTYDDLHGHMAGYLYSKTLQEKSLRKAVARLQGHDSVPIPDLSGEKS